MAVVPIVPIGAVVARRNRILRGFTKAGANSPERARSLDELGITHGHLVRRLVKGGVLRETLDGRFWFDEVANAAFHRRARVGVVIAILVALSTVALLVALGLLLNLKMAARLLRAVRRRSSSQPASRHAADQ